ncbi:carbohydrate ABC transporter permease [Paenibacillus mendelii]|uniref:Carbohydrate ABC transporter permease n=1 Tax=Paenibacillus mendelii TaxID=206163 RepID=A0ABV6JJH1_9BACL|nr:carbohydrate ABC transporter permease [Paenibacillus mendelii]MCQ6557582.1 carbohydrate ABC transporter permease [Paenibacillus mendelii]
MSEQNPTRGRLIRRRRYSLWDTSFHVINYTLIALIAFICIFPFVNTFANAFSSSHAIQAGKVVLWPVEFQLDAMKSVFWDDNVIRAMAVTIFVTLVGTAINMIFTILMAYPLSRRDLVGRKYFLNYMIFTMMFGGGLIPGYLLVKNLGMLNTLWAIMIPGAISAFNVIIMKSFFQNMPEELREAAIIDGCGNTRYLLRIVLPLSGAVMATIGLFYAVGHWNSYMGAVIMIDNPDLYTLQVRLRNILLLSQLDTSLEVMQQEGKLQVIEESLKAATAVFATVPILIVYPFLQKYFVKGSFLGSVKG